MFSCSIPFFKWVGFLLCNHVKCILKTLLNVVLLGNSVVVEEVLIFPNSLTLGTHQDTLPTIDVYRPMNKGVKNGGKKEAGSSVDS